MSSVVYLRAAFSKLNHLPLWGALGHDRPQGQRVQGAQIHKDNCLSPRVLPSHEVLNEFQLEEKPEHPRDGVQVGQAVHAPEDVAELVVCEGARGVVQGIFLP